MTDLTLIEQCLKSIGAQSIVVKEEKLSFNLHGENWDLEKKVGRYVIDKYYHDTQRGKILQSKIQNSLNKLGNEYKKKEKQKIDELRRERERQSRLRIEAAKALAAAEAAKQKERERQSRMGKEASKTLAAAEAAKIEGMAKEELAKLKLHHEEKQAELAAQMNRMKTLESEFASIKQQKKELAEARATEIVKRAKKSNWNVANPVQKNGKIRIDMTR